MKNLLAAGAAALALTALSACGGGETSTAEDPGPSGSSGSPAPVDGATAEPGSLPDFAEPDYTYVLEVFCYCPQTGPVRVTVEGGEVVDAVTVRKTPGTPKGSKAPEFLRKSINDLIAVANDPEIDDVEVDWPEGSAYPRRIVTDPIEDGVDDEATYSIRDVEVG